MTLKTKLKSYSALVASIGAVGALKGQSGIYQIFDSYYYSSFLDLDKDGTADIDITFSETNFPGAYRNANRYGTVDVLQSNFSVGNLSNGYLVSLDSLDAIDDTQRNFVQQGQITNVRYGVQYNTWVSYQTYNGYVTFSYFHCTGYQTTYNFQEWNNGYLPLKKVVDGHTYYGWLRIENYGSSYYIKDGYLSLDADRTVLAGQALGPVTNADVITVPSVSLMQMNRNVLVSRDFESSGMIMRLYDVMGRIVQSSVIDGHAQTFSFQNIPSGVYIIKISSEGHELKTQKLVFQ